MTTTTIALTANSIILPAITATQVITFTGTLGGSVVVNIPVSSNSSEFEVNIINNSNSIVLIADNTNSVNVPINLPLGFTVGLFSDNTRWYALGVPSNKAGGQTIINQPSPIPTTISTPTTVPTSIPTTVHTATSSGISSGVASGVSGPSHTAVSSGTASGISSGVSSGVSGIAGPTSVASGISGIPSSVASGISTPTGLSPINFQITKPLVGICAAGGEYSYQNFKSGNVPAGNNVDYQIMTNSQAQYYINKGCNFFRVTVGWELLFKNGTTLDPTVSSQLFTLIDYITSQNCYASISLHNGDSSNYCAYFGVKIPTSATVQGYFTTFWELIGAKYGNNPLVIFSLMNEPNTVDCLGWAKIQNQLIQTLRSKGIYNVVEYCPSAYSSPSDFFSDWDDVSSTPITNAQAYLTCNNGGKFVDPINNTIMVFHLYGDTDADGTATSLVNSNIFVTNLSPVVSWARTNGVKIHIEEYAASSTSSIASTALTNLLTYVNANTDVVKIMSWWCGGGSFYANGPYQFFVGPLSSGKDSLQMPLLQPIINGFK